MSSRSTCATKVPRSGAVGPGYICETSRIRTQRAYEKRRAAHAALRFEQRLLRQLRLVDPRERVDGRIPRAEWLQLEPRLDRLEDRRRVVLGVIDAERVHEARCEHERGNARTRTEQVMRACDATLAGWGHVIPLTAELVVGHDHHRVLRTRAALDRFQQRDEMGIAVRRRGVAGMLVLLADRLHEADSPEAAGLLPAAECLLELRLVLQVR